MLPFENDVTWDCDGPDLFDPSGMPIEVCTNKEGVYGDCCADRGDVLSEYDSTSQVDKCPPHSPRCLSPNNLV